MASAGHSSELQSVVALVKTLTNAQLKDILRSEGLAVSGVKASLQLRIIDCSFSLIFDISLSLQLVLKSTETE
jgi:hypothetical protein